MSWAKKAIKKLGRSIDKNITRTLKKNWYNPLYVVTKSLGNVYGSAYDEYKRNEGTYNRMAALIGASILTGGAAGALGGAAMGTGAAAGASAGATMGAATGTVAAGVNAYQENAANKAAEERERIAAEAAAEQERLQRLADLRSRGGTPENQLSILYANNGSTTSQHRRNQKTRTKQDTLGAGTSTLA